MIEAQFPLSPCSPSCPDRRRIDRAITRKNLRRRWAALTVLALCMALILSLFSSQTAAAQEEPPVRLNAEVGFDGECWGEGWLPVTVRLENDGPGVEGVLEVFTPVSRADEVIFSQPVDLPTQSRKEASLSIYSTGLVRTLNVRLRSGTRVLAETALRLSCRGETGLLIALAAETPSAFRSVGDLDRTAGPLYLAEIDVEDLPEHSAIFQEVDLLFVSGVDTGRLTSAQRQALADWVSGGGRLVVSGGPAWRQSTAGLAELLPLIPQGEQTLPSLGAMSAYSIAGMDPPQGEAVVTVGSLASGAQVLLEQERLPLVLSRQHGAGRVYFLAFDPSLEPLRSWPGLPDFYSALINEHLTLPPAWSWGFQNWDNARNALSTLPDLSLPSPLLVVGFLLLYVIAIGPLNYLVLRITKRRELAWVTIPALVLLFTALAFALGLSTRGARPVLARLAVVEVWPGSERARVSGLLGVFSPARATYDLSFAEGALVRQLPAGLGPADPGDWTFVQLPGGGSRLTGLRLDVSEQRSVVMDGWTSAPQFGQDLTLELDERGARLQGSLENRSDLRLSEAVIAGPGALHRLGEIAPHSQVDVQFDVQQGTQASEAGSQAFSSSQYGPWTMYNDTFISDLLDTFDFYRSSETYRRFMFLGSIIDYTHYPTLRPSEGYYLLGWSDVSPLQAEIEGKSARASDTTLYIFALQPELSAAGERLTLLPGLFTWSLLDADPSLYAPAPYNSSLNGGRFSVRFRLAQPLEYSGVESLVLNLMGEAGSGPAALDLSLWDFTENAWSPLPPFDWGEVEIGDPERFVGPQGEVRMQITNPDTFSSVFLNQADFTLVVTR